MGVDAAVSVETLYFVKNETEYQAALREIGSSQNFQILSYTDTPPYLSDHLACLPNVGQWQQYDVSNPEIARFWLMNYGEIDAFISPILNSKKKWDNELFNNAYFKQGVVSLIGEHYIELAQILDQFFSQKKVGRVCFSEGEGYFCFLLRAFANRLGMSCSLLSA